MTLHYLTLKHCGVVQVVEFTCECLFVLLKAAHIAGAGICERLQEAARGLTQHIPRGKQTEQNEDKRSCIKGKCSLSGVQLVHPLYALAGWTVSRLALTDGGLQDR